MKKALYAGLLILTLAALGLARGANRVRHLNLRTGEYEEISASAGNCRHHLAAHPDDYVKTVHGDLYTPDACN